MAKTEIKGKCRKTHLIIIMILCVVITIPLIIFGINSYISKASSYSQQEHVKRVSKPIYERYIKNGKFTDFKIFPLYDEKDEFKYFLIEFKPSGFIYISIRDEILNGCATNVMYAPCRELSPNKPWQRYTVTEGINPPPDKFDENYYPNRKWETDKNGEYIFYIDSPYKVSSIEDERRYLLSVYQNRVFNYIPAVKRGDKYLNLISMEEFEYKYESENEKYAVGDIYFIEDPHFHI